MNGKSDFMANFWRVVKELRFSFPSIQKVLAAEPVNKNETVGSQD